MFGSSRRRSSSVERVRQSARARRGCESWLDYVVPKRKQTSEKAKAKQMERFSIGPLIKKRGLHLGVNKWHETNLIRVQKHNWDGELEEGHERYIVFMTSLSRPTAALVEWYSDRWDIESGSLVFG